jgi:hypothetical protein
VKLAALKFAQCMRAHGVPNYPDPAFRGIEKPLSVYGINSDSPVVQNAERCAGELADTPARPLEPLLTSVGNVHLVV